MYEMSGEILLCETPGKAKGDSQRLGAAVADVFEVAPAGAGTSEARALLKASDKKLTLTGLVTLVGPMPALNDRPLSLSAHADAARYFSLA
jgi:hypothetical protein